MKKKGIMGGTFDPLHIAHLIIAERAYEDFGLDSVILMPAGIPPHKPGRTGASDKDRLEMARIAADGNPHLECSDYEMLKAGKSYTYETLEHFKVTEPDTELYFILGGDSLRDLHKWMKPERICQSAVILAAIRDNVDPSDFDELIRERNLTYNADIRLLRTPNIDISATDIRNRVKEGRSIRYLVTSEIEEYIKEHGLYLD